MNKKLDRRKKYTRKVLKESFIKLLAEKSISSITVKEICEMADINRSTFYTHYSDHYDLLDKIEEEITKDLSQYLNSYTFTIDEESLQMTQKLLEYITRNKFMFQTLLNKNGDPTFEQKLMEIAQSFMMKNWKTFNQVEEEQSRYLSTFVVSGAINVIKEWIEGDMGQTPKEMAVMINHFANYGVSYLDNK